MLKYNYILAKLHQGTYCRFRYVTFCCMHYIPRSDNGLGIPENGALGCQYHHTMMDNGNEGRREEMLGIFKEYLMNEYKDWNEDDLRYSKWDFLKV